MITYMNDLPDDQKPALYPLGSSGSSVNKEKGEAVGSGLETPALKEVGREGELSPEVTGVGVRMHPTSVPLPQPVQQLGVKQVGAATAPPTPSVALPLSDDQIAQGLHKSITSSWRWLAEWCMRRLRQLHMVVKRVHGKFVRVRR